MEYYFERYGDLELQRRMVSDRFRTDAFAQAIKEMVNPGDRVLDVGTGTGILAMLAAKAGAGRVFAIDQAEIAQTAANLVKANNLKDTVKILRGPAAELELDQPVDLIISEWLGHMAVVENMLNDVLEARDNNLRPGGAMMPAWTEILIAPVDDPVLYHHDGPGFWRRKVHGLDLSSLEEPELRQGRAAPMRIEPGAVLAEGGTMVRFDCTQMQPDDPFTSGSLTFKPLRDGVLNGFVGWFRCGLSPRVVLDAGPFEPETHWAQTYFSFKPCPVREGEDLELKFNLERDPDEPRHLRVTLEACDFEQTYTVE